jgi:5-methyltetrahydrofolate--homocysteine methyltransferase
MGDLLNKRTSGAYVARVKEDYAVLREKFLKRGKTKQYVPLEQARSNKYEIDWSEAELVKPKEIGVQRLKQISLKDLLPYFDWQPFFLSWDLHGKFPGILKDEVIGEQVSQLYEDAQVMIEKIISRKLLHPKAIFGLFEANTVGEDDIRVSKNGKELVTFRTLRQQLKKKDGVPNLALADFVAPEESGLQDHMGAFCVAIFGADEIASKYKEEHDDYHAILVQAIADRFAEAFAEYLHHQVRVKHWGYAPNEDLSNEELIKESYKGIRPAPGYPACPDHLEKDSIWELLGVEEHIGVKLTESRAMWPAAAVSGYYFASPQSKYFGLGKITSDQVEDYAKRKGIHVEMAQKWLQPNLA